jgi:para-nitrobenzyl esterase
MLRQVTVETGTLRGIPAADPRITAFLGVPFAAPPVGALRWRAPQPAASWEGVRPALEFAPISMQRIPGLAANDIYTREWNVDPEIPMDEDCLYLNVWTPAKRTDEKLPVYVWYFGGGLQVGNPAEMEFNGERIARRGIVVVTVNYRVNVFGFLAHPALTAEDRLFLGQLRKSRPEGRECVGPAHSRLSAGIGQHHDRRPVCGRGSVLTSWHSLDEGLFNVRSCRAVSCSEDTQHRSRSGRTLGLRKRKARHSSLHGSGDLEEARAIDACTRRDKALEYKGFLGDGR